MLLTVVSCDNKLSMMLPQGPEGPQGEPGKSAFEYWKEYYGQPDASVEDFLDAIKGDKGDTPEFKVSIGDDNTWHINGKSTGVKATGDNGKDGIDGKTPQFNVEIGTNGNWYINGVDTGKPSKGIDGTTPKIEIGADGYWYINDVKSIKAEGIDGVDGADGKTPSISINAEGFWVIDGLSTGVSALAPIVEIGSNGNWFVNGVDTGKPSQGNDGNTPSITIGSNGNWFINDIDTGKPSKGNDGLAGKTPIVEIGSNGNWFINGIDTGMPSKGKDGQDGKDGVTPKFTLTISDKGFWVINGVETTQPAQGKSAYIIWRDAVLSGEMTNKDGSQYTGGSSESDYFKWLQGGDISTLYIYWRDDATGINKDKTMDDFIKELFDCHCDGLSLSVSYANTCFSVDSEGELAKGLTANATLNVAGHAGTKLTLKKGADLITAAVIESEELDVTFEIPQTLDAQVFTLECELPAKKGQLPRTVTKTIGIEPIQYVPGVKSSLENINESTVKVIVSKPSVDVVIIVGSEDVDTDATWTKSDDGLTFSKLFKKGASANFLHIVASNDKGYCSNSSVLIDQLAPVEVASSYLTIFDDCQLELVVQGVPGMDVRVVWNKDNREISLTESSSGVYTVLLPRTYKVAKYEITASKEGYGDIKIAGETDLSLLLANPILVNNQIYNSTQNSTLNSTYFEFELRNPTSSTIEVKPSAFPNSNKSSKRNSPSWLSDASGGYILETDIISIPPYGSVKLNMHRDVTENYANGSYYARFETASQCGVPFVLDLYVRNQSDFKYGFSRPDGGSASGPIYDPVTEKYTVNAFVEDGFSDTPVQIFLAKDIRGEEVIAYHGFAYKSTNVDGYAELTFEMTKEEYDLALGKAGYIQFNLPNQKTYKRDVIFKFD